MKSYYDKLIEETTMGNEKQILLEGIERFLADKDDVVMGINFFPMPRANRDYNVYFSKIGVGQPKTIGHRSSPDLVDALRGAYESAIVTYELLKKK